MTKEKKTSNLTVRLEAKEVERLETLENAIGVSRAEIVRQALDAVWRAFNEDGRLSFPINVYANSDRERVAQLMSASISKEEILEAVRQQFQETLDAQVNDIVKASKKAR